MKKLIIALLALAVLFSLAAPAMAASPAKDYASAQDGDLLYTLNFKGDEVYTPGIAGGFKFSLLIPSEDGSALEIKPNDVDENDTTKYGWYLPSQEGKTPGSSKPTGNVYGGTISGMKADATTKYTMTYKIWLEEGEGGEYKTGGKQSFVGVGGLYYWNASKNAYRWMNFASGFNHKVEDCRYYAFQHGGSTIGNSKVTYESADFVGAKDADGYYTVRLTFDGPNATATAYILKTGTGAKESDWAKLTSSVYDIVEGKEDLVSFWIYTYQSATHAKIKDVKYFKGLVTGVDAPADETPDEPSKTADTFTGMIVALFVLSAGAVVTLTTSRKRFF